MRLFFKIMVLTCFLALPVMANVAEGLAADSVNTEQSASSEQEGGMKDDMDDVSDPLEGWNRLMYTFNDMLYFGIIKPLATLYAAITPEGFRINVRNFFHNLAMPQHFVSALLQGDIQGAGRELGRFGINTVLGLGLFDVAESSFGLSSGNEDIGQALGSMGMGDDLFLVWPVIGPSNFRDTVGYVGDTALNPLTYYPGDQWTRVGIQAYKVVNNTSLRIGEYEEMKEAALDPYISLRDAYLQMRRKQIAE
ncbi:MAG: VacJ family lipoprotein [Magnetococcales bacterium]|nr:VacJ family lipoprotein [Magnetococcales bacterium]